MSHSVETLTTDILIIGGGAAGCAAAVEAREIAPHLDVTLVEKADIARSGCLAMGLNAVNAYLRDGTSPEAYVEHVRRDSHGIVREDLVLSIAEEVNRATHRVEAWGLPIPRDKNGKPYPKGPRSIRILGESLKPILARRVRRAGARVVSRHALVDLRLEDGRVVGAWFLGVRTGKLLQVRARATILATGGASGLYRTPNRDDARSRMWYSPYNVGTGYAAALRAGAELTTLEMRFVPTRIVATAAPTGTLAQAFGAREVNLLGEPYLARYARDWGAERLTTAQRLRAQIEELKAGRGPISLCLESQDPAAVGDVLGAYLDMVPAQVAAWASTGFSPERAAVEISTSGPYLLGGHTASGLWVDVDRRATLEGLYAAGDVAGGAPKKYVSGAWVEGFRAARTAVGDIRQGRHRLLRETAGGEALMTRLHKPLDHPGSLEPSVVTGRLQRIMDEYAGGISTHYELHGARLERAAQELEAIEEDLCALGVADFHGLLLARELTDRVLVARALVAHLTARTETRWPGYQTRVDHPKEDPEWLCFVNSRYETGQFHMSTLPLQGTCREGLAHACAS